MGRIAEDVLLLLLDNASAQPVLPQRLSRRLLAAAVLLDLAYDGRIRPALPDETAQGCLVALVVLPTRSRGQAGTGLLQRALTPATAVGKAQQACRRRRARSTPSHRADPPGAAETGRFKANAYAWPLNDRAGWTPFAPRCWRCCSKANSPDPPTAAVIALLHACDGLGTLFNLNDRGREWGVQRAGEISSGSWVSDNQMGRSTLR